VQRRPGDRVAASNLLLALHYCDDIDADTIADAHRAWGRTIEPGGAAARPEPRGHRQGRLRVGLLSGDFNDHAVMRFLAPLLERHDRTRLELRCYYTGLREDASTADARRLADAFIEAGGLAEPDLAERLRADALDILVDLSGHSSGGRPGVLALRPAPLQASWLGYLDTTGLAAVDFRISDATCDPPGLTERLHTERLWRLEAMWCYQPRADAPAPEPAPALAAGHVTFGSTNNPAKLSDSALSLWASVLREVHGSRLVLHAHDDPLCRDRIARAFADLAIDPDRIACFGREDAAGYLRRYATMDVLLDTTPYSGGTTTCDALWMGVPVVTLAGDRPFSRTSASVLQAAGCPEWIATDRDGFVRIAKSLAEDREGLGRLRRELRGKLQASRLTDADAFARSMEAALASMQSALVPAPQEGNRP
jgi:predicted O-linked N-acetylglucosamine transferase (SPINDLY family)